MTSSKKNFLITGLPGVGKTTLVRNLTVALKTLHPVGFYTSEIREGGVRKGFELVTFNGGRRLFSHVDIKSPFRVGKYGVNIAAFEDCLDLIDYLNPAAKVIVVDEIGKMECLSEKFKNLIQEILDSDRFVIATIAAKGSGIIADIKRRQDIRLFEITPQNRDSLVPLILTLFRK